MARTRSEIKTLIRAHTGRTEDTLESSLCDSALKLALMRHPFSDATAVQTDLAITEATYTVDISSITNIIEIVSATIVEADGTRNRPLIMKNRAWWDKHVVNPEDNQQGWPMYGLKDGTDVLFERPCDSGLELRLRVTTEQTFASDATECPISVLDLFVEYFATAGVFENITNWEAAHYWRNKALGSSWDRAGEPGGELLNAINSDRVDASGDMAVESGRHPMMPRGIAIENLMDWSDRYGETDFYSPG